jgi:hypothetical protein
VSTLVQTAGGIAGFSSISGTGKSVFVELKITEFWVKILRDQDRYSVEAMLEALLPSLDWHPVSDRRLHSTRKSNQSPLLSAPTSAPDMPK